MGQLASVPPMEGTCERELTSGAAQGIGRPAAGNASHGPRRRVSAAGTMVNRVVQRTVWSGADGRSQVTLRCGFGLATTRPRCSRDHRLTGAVPFLQRP